MTKRYGHFYWPLALSGIALLLEHQFQNGILARYPNADVELATFALAASSFQLVNALLAFIPQMVVVLARSPADRARCRRFANGAGLLLSLPLLAMGFTTPGARLLATGMNIPPDLLPAVVRYLQWLAPLVWVNAIRHYCTGILVLSERTRCVTILNGVHLVSLVGILLFGRQAGWGALPTLALATVFSNLLHFALGLFLIRTGDIPARHARDASPVSFADIFRFFWPLATTSMFFAMSRPVLYAYVNLTADAVMTIAALRVGFDFCLLVQNPLNQFRHVYATYGEADPKGVTRFMVKVTALFMVAMATVVFSPLSRVFFSRFMGLDGELLARALQCVRIFMFVPAIIMVRNLYHGKMMVRRTTAAMATAALLRVVAIALTAKALAATGGLTHVAAAWVAVIGFGVEAFVVRCSVRRRPRAR